MAVALVTMVNATATPTCGVKGFRLWAERYSYRTGTCSEFNPSPYLASNGTIFYNSCKTTFEAIIDYKGGCEVRDVRLKITGADLSSGRTEGAEPYFLFGNDGDDAEMTVCNPNALVAGV